MANRIVSVHAGIYGMGIYAFMLPSSGFSVAHCGSEMNSDNITALPLINNEVPTELTI